MVSEDLNIDESAADACETLGVDLFRRNVLGDRDRIILVIRFLLLIGEEDDDVLTTGRAIAIMSSFVGDLTSFVSAAGENRL